MNTKQTGQARMHAALPWRQDLVGGLVIIAVAGLAFWLARGLGSVIPDKAGRTPQALSDPVKSEVARWTPILKAAMAAAGAQSSERLP